MNLTGFQPNAARARVLDARMHAELAASLGHLAEVTASADAALALDIEAEASRLSAGRRVPADVFAAYFILTEALIDGDEAAARAALGRIAAAPERPAERTIHRAGAPEDDGLVRTLLARQGGPIKSFAAVTAEEAAAFDTLLKDAFALLSAAAPVLAEELSILLRGVLLARPSDPAVFNFDGASHYQFWGLVMLNPDHMPSTLKLAETLAHEVSHMLLFGMTVDEPLVLNPDEELFASPLREDLRPMDGIFHATYVSARMTMAMTALAACDALTEADRDAARRMAETDRRNFEAGDAVIRDHGRLSATGAEVLDAARDWMERAAAGTALPA